MKRLLWVSLIIAVFLIGLFLGHYATRFYTLEFKKELGLGDLINFIAVIVVAFVLQNYIQKRFGNERAEKDHVIDLIKEPMSYLKDSRSTFTNAYEKKKPVTREDQKVIKAQIRNLSNSIVLLKETLTECNNQDGVAECVKLEGFYRDYKDALTGRSFPTKSYDSDAYADAEKAYGQAVSLLNNLRINVNRT